jgi:hypothetical protein
LASKSRTFLEQNSDSPAFFKTNPAFFVGKKPARQQRLFARGEAVLIGLNWPSRLPTKPWAQMAGEAVPFFQPIGEKSKNAVSLLADYSHDFPTFFQLF